MSSDQWRRGLRADSVEVGMLGEMAVARYLGLPIDVGRKPNHGADFRLKTGEGIEVKTGRLLVKVGATLSRFYVFCRIAEDDAVNIAGFISSDELQKQKIAMGKGDWLNYEVDGKYLTHISALRKYIHSLENAA